jgi:hypothetical protein
VAGVKGFGATATSEIFKIDSGKEREGKFVMNKGRNGNVVGFNEITS